MTSSSLITVAAWSGGICQGRAATRRGSGGFPAGQLGVPLTVYQNRRMD